MKMTFLGQLMKVELLWNLLAQTIDHPDSIEVDKPQRPLTKRPLGAKGASSCSVRLQKKKPQNVV